MTRNTRTEAEQLVPSTDGAEEPTSNPERGGGGCQPVRRLKLSAGIVSGRENNTATNLEKAVNFAQHARDNGMKDFPDPTADGSLIDTSQNPSAARSGARSTPGFRAASHRCAALYSSAFGLQGK